MDYKLKFSNRKTIGIKISMQEGLVVTAPFGCPQYEIDRALEKRKDWIEEKLGAMKRQRNLSNDRFPREKLLYLGRSYDIKIRYSYLKTSQAKLKDDYFEIRLNELLKFNRIKRTEAISKAIRQWYRDMGYKVMKERTDHYSGRMGLSYNKLMIKDVKSRWGSCSSNKNINYNIKLMLMPLELIDYIVVHELSHLVYMNHSKAYWSYVEKYMEDYKHRDRAIKELSPDINAYWNSLL